MATDPADHRRATAERNVQAIFDAAEALLHEGKAVSIAAVAGRAGVSRGPSTPVSPRASRYSRP